MPARDPAASPRHPTSFGSPPVFPQPPVLPTHVQSPPVRIVSPSSPSQSYRTFPSQYAAFSPPDSPRLRHGGGQAGRMRKSSLGPQRIETSRYEDEAGPSNQLARSRKRSQDLSDARHSGTTPGTSLSSSSQAIRDSSNRLASLSFTSRPRRISSASGSSGETQHPSPSPLSPVRPLDHRPIHPSHLVTSRTADELPPPKAIVPSPMSNMGRSGLSMMMDREGEKAREAPSSPGETDSQESLAIPRPDGVVESSPFSDEGSGETTPVARKTSRSKHSDGSGDVDADSSSALQRYLASEVEREDMERATETTSLIGRGSSKTPILHTLRSGWTDVKRRAGKLTAREVVRGCVEEPVKTLPAVILGSLLNMLDGVSYGMILFPASPIFLDFGSLGVSMFFVSCIVSQLVFSLGGSVFPGGNGSMMIEAVPFFHILVGIIEGEIGDDPASIIATTMAAFAFSSILTGLVFFALGAFKLGSLIGYFPRHILVGCIGGVGIFLIETGLEVSRGLKEEGFEYNLATLKLFFESPHAILLWTIPLALAILLRVVTHFFHHQLVFPAYFFAIPIIFYVIVAGGGWDLDLLREEGWIFDVGRNTQSWWKFYSCFVPALGVSLSEDDVKLDRELVAHGFSNLAAGFTGTVPNYLCYVNTVLFYRVGGGSRLSGLMLTLATTAIMFVGPTVIGYLPTMLVGALIFVLGLDLTVEAVWDTRHRVNRMEYITIWAIAIGMTLWDFVIGLLFGVILACVFFVVQSSRRRAIRAVFSGATARSTVRRPRSQRAFIQQVGSQTYVMKLQGFLFFGTISAVEDEIRKLLDLAKWQDNPIRFLIIDFGLVHGLDFSSAEAFVRVQRLLATKDVLLILCGAARTGLVGTALRCVDLWSDRGGTRVEVFDGLNDALEWTENAYLTAFYENQKATAANESTKGIDFPKIAKPPFSLAESFSNSPRRTHLAKAGDDTLPRNFSLEELTPSNSDDDQPLQILVQTFGGYCDDPLDFSRELVPFFAERVLPSGTTLFRQDDRADGLYLIESGSLRATYTYDDHGELVQETMVAGTIAGDLSTLSDTSRNATVVAERDCVLWKMDSQGLESLEKEKRVVAQRFIRIVLKAVAEEQDVLSSHLIAVLS